MGLRRDISPFFCWLRCSASGPEVPCTKDWIGEIAEFRVLTGPKMEIYNASMMLLIAVAVLLLDQFTKHLVLRMMTPEQSIPLITGVFHLTFVRNPGAAFGMFAYQTRFFIAVTVIVIGLLILYSRQIRGDSRWARIALGLQLGGAVGNLIDRVRWGRVIDFLDFRVWPVFNVADSAIVVGALVFVILIWRAAPRDESVSGGEQP